MEYYLDTAGVVGRCRASTLNILFALLTLLTGSRLRRAKVSARKRGRRAHFNAVAVFEVIERVRRARHVTTVHDYLVRVKRAAAECPSLTGEEKTKVFVHSLCAGVGASVDVRRPGNMHKAIAEAVRIEAGQADRSRERRAGRGEPPRCQARAGRTEAREPHLRHLQVGARLSDTVGSLCPQRAGDRRRVEVRGSLTSGASRLGRGFRILSGLCVLSERGTAGGFEVRGRTKAARATGLSVEG